MHAKPSLPAAWPLVASVRGNLRPRPVEILQATSSSDLTWHCMWWANIQQQRPGNVCRRATSSNLTWHCVFGRKLHLKSTSRRFVEIWGLGLWKFWQQHPALTQPGTVCLRKLHLKSTSRRRFQPASTFTGASCCPRKIWGLGSWKFWRDTVCWWPKLFKSTSGSLWEVSSCWWRSMLPITRRIPSYLVLSYQAEPTTSQPPKPTSSKFIRNASQGRT